MKLQEITHFLEQIAPLHLQESYDNAGLITGHSQQVIKKVLISLDCTEAVIDEAIAAEANLIIAHHPIVFSGLKKLTGKSYIERVVIKAIKHDIAIYAIHTNLDNVASGVNAKIAEKLGLRKVQILAPKTGLLKKLITFCPTEHADRVRAALFAAGAGHIGNYAECSFNSEGFGTFRAGEGTNAFVGKKGEQHREQELKIEVIYPIWLEQPLISVLKSNHPYEEVAYDCIALSNHHEQVGAGMIGVLDQEMDSLSFLKQVQKTFHCAVIRHTALHQATVKKIAICGGAGSFLLNDALCQGADVFLTADYKYHQFFEADGRIIIADIGHYESEQFTGELLLEKIKNNFPTFAVQLCSVNTNPVHYLS